MTPDASPLAPRPWADPIGKSGRIMRLGCISSMAALASDEGRSQAMVTLIGLYLDEMGISRHLLDAASITPGARMTTLTVDDARRLGVDNSEPPLASWETRTTADGRLYACVLQVVSARKSVSVCLGREGGHWVANITFVNRLTTRSNEEVLATAMPTRKSKKRG